MSSNSSVVRHRQAPLRAAYKANPEDAVIFKHASATWTGDADPFHGVVVAGDSYGVAWPFGIDRAIGGDHDAPNPAELLCAALAACTDATIRMVADGLGIVLQRVDVQIVGTVDVKGCLAMDARAPVGFQTMHCDARIVAAPNTRPELLERLCETAERACITLETLRKGVPVAVSFHLNEDGRENALADSRPARAGTGA